MASTTAPARSQINVVAFASAIGCTIEWYDFFLYGTVTGLVFNKLFFPTFNPVVGTLLAYTTFAVGFVTRPIGGIIFGHFGDRFGRKRMLVLTLSIMGIATFLIGFLPTYAQVGVLAPIMLLCIRVVQGIGIGGEWGGAVLMAAEHAPSDRRGFYASWVQIGVPAGLALGTGTVAILSSFGDAFFLGIGWRLAFLASVVLVVVGVYIRLKIVETPAFEQTRVANKIAPVPFATLMRTAWRNVLLGMGVRWIEGVGFNLYGVFLIAYLAGTLKYPRSQVLTAVTLAAIVMAFFIPYFGKLSDRIGRRRVFAAGAIATGILVFPAFMLMQSGVGWIWVGIGIPFGIAYAALYGPEAALFSELFDTPVRYSGISFVYQFSGIFASGLTPLIAAWLVAANHGAPWFVASYVAAVASVSLICVLSIRQTYAAERGGLAEPLAAGI